MQDADDDGPTGGPEDDRVGSQKSSGEYDSEGIENVGEHVAKGKGRGKGKQGGRKANAAVAKAPKKTGDTSNGDDKSTLKRPAASMKRPAAAANGHDSGDDGDAELRNRRKARKFNLAWKHGTLPEQARVKLEEVEGNKKMALTDMQLPRS